MLRHAKSLGSCLEEGTWATVELLEASPAKERLRMGILGVYKITNLL